MRQTVIEIEGVLLDEGLTVTFTELGQLCGADAEAIERLVAEGVLRPVGRRREEWCFSGREIGRARRALRLLRDLELNLAGAALAVELLDEIEALRARLRLLERDVDR
ncbi:chaperone modulator CbpM [Thiococcus pfennigii]|jgi:chaperone modulatory protein CbpM|uniref:chaperone modulator CbpM n=1 Tax=Thiococcus pfennigii TaxID=1057 RepID=UPI0019081C07|nr:chaperone modulator CbpM [Thiococcus pfennigii]MBK1699455.1 MerR family transcriptional regulator [Thiococcus pfennigii]MBK1730264.1 MerR family transcriptional regulator [Thiococcus pfennigii]